MFLARWVYLAANTSWYTTLNFPKSIMLQNPEPIQTWLFWVAEATRTGRAATAWGRSLNFRRYSSGSELILAVCDQCASTAPEGPKLKELTVKALLVSEATKNPGDRDNCVWLAINWFWTGSREREWFKEKSDCSCNQASNITTSLWGLFENTFIRLRSDAPWALQYLHARCILKI